MGCRDVEHIDRAVVNEVKGACKELERSLDDNNETAKDLQDMEQQIKYHARNTAMVVDTIAKGVSKGWGSSTERSKVWKNDVTL